MRITDIRQQLHDFIEHADDKRIQGLYLFIEDEIESKRICELSDEEIALLDKERMLHLNGESKSYTWEEAKDIIR